MNNKLTIKPSKIFVGAIAYCSHYRVLLVKVLTVPFVFLFLVEVSDRYFDSLYDFGWLGPMFSMVRLVLLLLLTSGIAVLVHRIMLLSGQGSKAEISKLVKIIAWFTLYSLALVVIIIPLALLAVIPVVGVFLAIMAMAYVWSRLSLVFPGIAIGKGVSFRLSWRLTKDHQWPVFVVVGVIPLLLMMAIGLCRPNELLWPIAPFLDALTTVLTVAALSLIYREIIRTELEEAAG